MSMYLKLFHGRVAGAGSATKYDGTPLDDWGHCGPTFGPVTYVHTTYGVHMNIEYAKDEADRTLNITNGDVVLFDGHEYGDWSVYEATEPDLGCGSNPFYDRCHGSDVCLSNGVETVVGRKNVLIGTGGAFDAAQHDHPPYVPVVDKATETMFDLFQRAAEAALTPEHATFLDACDALDEELRKPEYEPVLAWYQLLNDVAGNDVSVRETVTGDERVKLTRLHEEVNYWFAVAHEGQSGSSTAHEIREILRNG
tara:strand:+ start:358 stop:1116 length:759 start_codon:yes stop_codon:yes gene_type:complete